MAINYGQEVNLYKLMLCIPLLSRVFTRLLFILRDNLCENNFFCFYMRLQKHLLTMLCMLLQTVLELTYRL